MEQKNTAQQGGGEISSCHFISVLDAAVLERALFPGGMLQPLAAHNQFIIYKAEADGKGGKPNKRPCDTNGNVKSAHDSQYWLDYTSALYHAGRLNDQMGHVQFGIGYVLTSDDDFFCVDIDHCVLHDGSLTDRARQILAMVPECALEVSVSGTGLHLWMRGARHIRPHLRPGTQGTNTGEIEVYAGLRFIALTGRRPSAMNQVGDADAEISVEAAKLFADTFLPRAHSDERKRPTEWRTTPEDGYRGPDDDDELIEFARTHPTSAQVMGSSATFSALFDADDAVLVQHFKKPSGECDRSRVDLALASRLMYFTGNNHERTRKIMLRSKLWREKWEDSGYLNERTIKKAYSNEILGRRSEQATKTVVPVQGLTANGAELVIGSDPSQKLSRYEPLPFTTEGGRPLKVVGNFQAIVERLGITIRYNVDKNTPEIIVPGKEFLRDTEEEAKRAFLKTVCAFYQLPADDLDDWIVLIAQANPYSPFQEYVKLKPWDGVDHFGALCASLTVKDDKPLPDGRLLSRVLVQCFMTGVIAASFTPKGCPQQLVLVLQGPQGLGKSRWAAKLLPADLGVYLGDAKLDPHNKDDLIQVLSHVITELSELDGTLSRADIARLKAVFTALEVVVRLPYARRFRRIIRRTGFIATVNRSDFLVDDTGNRRFGVLSLAAVDANHTVDMQQAWAQIWELWKAGAKPYLSAEELAVLNESNERFKAISAVEDLILSRLDWEAPETLWVWRTVAEIVEDVGLRKEDRGNVTKAGALLTQRGCSETRSGGVRRRKVPPLVPLNIRLGIQS